MWSENDPDSLSTNSNLPYTRAPSQNTPTSLLDGQAGLFPNENGDDSRRNGKRSFHTNGTSTSSGYAGSSLIEACSHGTDKYTGAFDDNLDRKLEIFNERCGLSGVDLLTRDVPFLLCSVVLLYSITWK